MSFLFERASLFTHNQRTCTFGPVVKWTVVQDGPLFVMEWSKDVCSWVTVNFLE